MRVILAVLKQKRQHTAVINIPGDIVVTPGIHLLMDSPTGSLRVPIKDIDINVGGGIHVLRVDPSYLGVEELLKNPHLEFFPTEHT